MCAERGRERERGRNVWILRANELVNTTKEDSCKYIQNGFGSRSRVWIVKKWGDGEKILSQRER
jgi:hypothetical protein